MKINMNKENEWDERRKAFLQSNEGKRIAEKKRPKSYEERNGALRDFAKKASYLFNIISIVTGASSGYALTYSILTNANLPVWLWVLLSFVCSLSALALIEKGQRFFSQPFFEKFVAGKLEMENLGLFVMLIFLSGTSIFLSVDGSFELPKIGKKEKAFVVSELQSIEDVKAHFEPLILEAKMDVDTFYSKKLYRGKISDENTEEWNRLRQIKNDLISQMNDKIDLVELKNQDQERLAKIEHNKKIEAEKLEAQNTGFGLAGVAVFSIACFYLCMWYMEKYDHEVATQYDESVTISNANGNVAATLATNAKNGVANLKQKDITATVTIDKNMEESVTDNAANKVITDSLGVAGELSDSAKNYPFSLPDGYNEMATEDRINGLLEIRRKKKGLVNAHKSKLKNGKGNAITNENAIQKNESYIKQIDLFLAVEQAEKV